jgi:hypothetical protein
VCHHQMVVREYEAWLAESTAFRLRSLTSTPSEPPLTSATLTGPAELSRGQILGKCCFADTIRVRMWCFILRI